MNKKLGDQTNKEKERCRTNSLRVLDTHLTHAKTLMIVEIRHYIKNK